MKNTKTSAITELQTVMAAVLCKSVRRVVVATNSMEILQQSKNLMTEL